MIILEVICNICKYEFATEDCSTPVYCPNCESLDTESYQKEIE